MNNNSIKLKHKEMIKVKVKDLFEGYENLEEEEGGVSSMNTTLNIRPKYQRGFVYSDNKQNAVIQTVLEGLPLSIMYWATTPTGYEVLDGQQRTMSICEYLNNQFAYTDSENKPCSFNSQPNDIKEKILNYEINVFIFDGTDSEKLKWFKRINEAGAILTKQEINNAVYCGTWLEDAKKYFSSKTKYAYKDGSKYVDVNDSRESPKSVNRHFLLETALKWIGYRDDCSVDEYMDLHKHNKEALDLWNYFEKIINWAKTNFEYRAVPMKTIDWGYLYNKYKSVKINKKLVEEQISSLMNDNEITNKEGIYEYIFDGEEKHLSIREFSKLQKTTQYNKQGSKCAYCGGKKDLCDMVGDHIIPWSKGGKTLEDNLQMLCVPCNLKKSNH